MKPAVIDPKTTTRAEACERWMNAPNPMVTVLHCKRNHPLILLQED